MQPAVAMTFKTAYLALTEGWGHPYAGLGLYEYMLLVEELDAEPIWVLNNGLSHEESVPTAQIQPLVQDALDSIEFIVGSPGSTWGSLRARMGHPDPWHLTFIGIGNEVPACLLIQNAA